MTKARDDLTSRRARVIMRAQGETAGRRWFLRLVVTRSNRLLGSIWRLLLFCMCPVDYVQDQLYDRDDHKDELNIAIGEKV